MNETYNFIRDLMFGRKPLHRENPTAGQSEWYYMTPKNPNDLDNSEFDFVDVPTQNTPNPLLEKSFTNSVQTPLPATSIASPTTTSVPQPLPVGNCLVKNSDIGNISSTDTLNDDINRLVTTLANLPSTVNKQLPQAANMAYHIVEPIGRVTEGAALSFTNGRTFGAFDELAGIEGGIVGTGKAMMNNQNPWNGFVHGYSAVRNDLRRKRKEAEDSYSIISTPMELLGGGFAGNGIHIINNAVSSAIGYAEAPEDIKKTTFTNLIGNGMAKILPTNRLPYPLNLMGGEYVSRYLPDWLKTSDNK